MSESNDPSPAAVEAFRLIQSDDDIEILEPLHGIPEGEAGASRFTCSLAVDPQPNLENLPARARLRVEMASTFPLSGVDIYAEDPEFQAFPHQDAETGKLCLRVEQRAPWNAQRLGVYLSWAKEWLSDAATGDLLRAGDPFELPDFSRRKLPRPLPTNLPILFDESSATFPAWNDMIGKSGGVELLLGRHIQGLLTMEFWHQGNTITERTYTDGVFKPPKPGAGIRIRGRWILLPDLRFYRQRPAQTFGELHQLCRASDVNLGQVLRDAWEYRNKNPWVSILLIGQPIPKIVGDVPTEVHWQPLMFECEREDRRISKPKFGSMKLNRLWNHILREGRFAPNAPLPWGKSVNVSRGRMYARGAVPQSVQTCRIVLGGCGALGAPIAEMLARGGAEHLSIFDPDVYELGNQCRHTLDGSDLGENKAEALARRLLSSNPLSEIQGFRSSLPLSEDPNHRPEGAIEAIHQAGLFIDCTTDDGAFLWLNDKAKESKARLVTMFVNFGAEILTLCISGKQTSCRKVCNRLYADIAAGQTPIRPTEYFGGPAAKELIVPGPGCWHPTFPARINQIWLLAAAAFESMVGVLNASYGTDGTAILIRRTGGAAMAEKVWDRQYR